jgi:hypothetical protein
MEILLLTPNRMRTHLEFTTTENSDKLWMLLTDPKVVMQIGKLTWSRSAAWCSFAD